MHEQILKELKNKYKDLGLSESILKAYAKKIDKAVNEESEIENAVADVEEDLRIFQAISDQNRTLKTEIESLKKPKDDKKSEENKTDEKPKEGEQPNPMLEILKELKNEIAGMKAEKVNQTNEQKLIAKLQELGVNENFYKVAIAGRTFESDQQINDFAETLKQSQDAVLQSTNNERLKDLAPPQFGTGVKEGEVSPIAKAFIEAKKTNK